MTLPSSARPSDGTKNLKKGIVTALAAVAIITPLLAAPPAFAFPAFCDTAAGRAQYSIAVAWGECGPTTDLGPASSGSGAAAPAPPVDQPGTGPQVATLPQIAQGGSPWTAGDDNGGRCDWAHAVGWSQYVQCTLHIGPQTADQYRLQQEDQNCHALHGQDPDHRDCPDITINGPATG